MTHRISGLLSRHRQSLALFVVLLTCYAYFFPRWADWNENSRFNLVLALVDDGTVQIDKYVGNTGDYAYVDGHYYSDKAPGMALLGVPVYAAFRALVPDAALQHLHSVADDSRALGATLRPGGTGLQAGKLDVFVALALTTFVTVAVPSAGLGVLVAWMASQLGASRAQGLVVAVLYGLATNAFAYANSFVGHQTSATLLFAAFVLLFAIRRDMVRSWWLVGVGLLLGYAAITEYPTVLISGILGLYALAVSRSRLRTLLYLAAGVLPPLALMGVHDYAAFGTVLPIGYFHSALWTDVHSTGFVSLTYPHPDALLGITFGVHRGLFFLSPFLLFAAPGYVALWRRPERRAEFWVLLLAPVAFLLFNASSAMWQGGFAVGPRYLVASLPFLGLVAGLGLVLSWRRRMVRPIAAMAVTWSFAAVWTETIGGQAFPDYTANPLFDFSLPRLLAGDIARNAGMLVGLPGWSSLLPLLAVAVLAAPLVGVGGPARPAQAVPGPRRKEAASAMGMVGR